MSAKKHRYPSTQACALLASLTALLSGTPVHSQDNNFVDCRPDGSLSGWVCQIDPIAETPAPDQPLTSDARADASDDSTAPDRVPARNESDRRSAVTGQPDAANFRGDELDWVPREQMTPEELALLPDNCCGAFIEPPRPGIDNDQNPDQAPIVFQTDQGFQRQADDTINIDGVARISQGSRTVTNDQATTIDGTTRSLLMQGNVEFREPGVLMRGNSAFVDNQSSSSRLEQATYVLHDYGAHGTAESILYSSESSQLTIENGEFSRCEPGSNFWRLSAESIVIDTVEGRGYARGPQLRIRDVPVFYYPFTLTFPLQDERVSGFLAPSAGSTRDGGFDLQVPYYFNLAPDYDATLSPRLISDRGVLINGEARYLSDWSMNTLNVSHLADDKLFETDGSATLSIDSPSQADRWFVGLEHLGVLGENWTTFIDYNAVSDFAYFDDFGSAGLNVSSRTHLNRQGYLAFNNELLRASLNVQRTQILDFRLDPRFAQADINRPFDRLPQFIVDTELPLPGDLRLGLNAQFTSFDRDLNQDLLSSEQIQAGALVNGNRINLEPTLSWALEAPGWFVRPTASYRFIGYDLEEQGAFTESDPDVGVGVFSLDAGLVFERPMDLGAGFTQTLEPRFYYLNSGFEDQSTLPLFDTTEYSFSFNQLFRDDRFSGGDRISNANQLSTAVTSRILDGEGRERARLSLGRINYFEDRLVNLGNPLQSWIPLYSTTSSGSALLGEVGYAFNDSWRVRADIQWDEDLGQVNEGSFQFNFQSRGDLVFNAAYRYRNINTLQNFALAPEVDPRIKQADVSAVLPVNANWRILGRWNYDFANSRNLETFAGVEFSNCCTTVRIIAREWVRPFELFLPNIEPDRGIFFQFTLNGLGNIAGGGLSQLLSDSIEGFRDFTSRN